MIVGFPGETRLAHLNMLAGLRELRFNWLGAFQYSAEDGTPAGSMPGQLSAATRKRRWEAVMDTQAEITGAWNRGRAGTQARVLIESYDPAAGQWIGRTACEAADVDGSVFVESALPLEPGTFVLADIIAADTYDLHARAISL